MLKSAGARHLWVWYSPFGQGGVETYLLNMARETVKDGGQMWIAATKSADGPMRQLFTNAGAQFLDWTEYHGAFMSHQPGAPIQARMVADLVQIQPTLLALNDCNDFSIGTASMLRQLRTYCTIIDTLHIDSPVRQYLDFRQRFVDVLDGVAATNQNTVHRFKQRYPRAASMDVRYVPNGVAMEDRKHAPHDGTLRLLYVGRLAQDQKRILDLPPLLEQLQARAKPFAMTIVGDGPCREALASDLSRRSLADRVRLTGYLPPDEVANLYLSHDALVNLSTFEGFSMSVLEALAAGCVPVCTDIAGLDHSAFLDSINCRLCAVDRLEDMVGIWEALTPESLRSMSMAARATGRRFSANNTYAAYRELIGELRAKRPLAPWPSDSALALRVDWDLTLHNPWLRKPHRLGSLAHSIWGRIARTANGLRDHR
jgi:glycosyltransferase involved in cell wall biosynthesis